MRMLRQFKECKKEDVELLTPLALSPTLWMIPVVGGIVSLFVGLSLTAAMAAHYLVASRMAPSEMRKQALSILRFFVPPAGDR